MTVTLSRVPLLTASVTRDSAADLASLSVERLPAALAWQFIKDFCIMHTMK